MLASAPLLLALAGVAAQPPDAGAAQALLKPCEDVPPTQLQQIVATITEDAHLRSSLLSCKDVDDLALCNHNLAQRLCQKTCNTCGTDGKSVASLPEASGHSDDLTMEGIHGRALKGHGHRPHRHQEHSAEDLEKCADDLARCFEV